MTPTVSMSVTSYAQARSTSSKTWPSCDELLFRLLVRRRGSLPRTGARVHHRCLGKSATLAEQAAP